VQGVISRVRWEARGQPDLDPALTQIRRLAPHLVSGELRDALARQDRIRAANTAAHQRHLNATWITTRHHNAGVDLTDN